MQQIEQLDREAALGFRWRSGWWDRIPRWEEEAVGFGGGLGEGIEGDRVRGSRERKGVGQVAAEGKGWMGHLPKI